VESEEGMKPVKCGCGGEAKKCHGPFKGGPYFVQCCDCGLRTDYWQTGLQAIAYWNTAMGADLREVVEIAINQLESEKAEWSKALADDLEAAMKGEKA
jgi:hypothetical protein